MSKERRAAIEKERMEDKAKASMQDELKCMLANHDKGLKEPMVEQSCNHASKLAVLKQSQMATQNLFTQKNMPPMLKFFSVPRAIHRAHVLYVQYFID
jgi:hypothetical protein